MNLYSKFVSSKLSNAAAQGGKDDSAAQGGDAAQSVNWSLLTAPCIVLKSIDTFTQF
jgi:hypothetical protein